MKERKRGGGERKRERLGEKEREREKKKRRLKEPEERAGREREGGREAVWSLSEKREIVLHGF